MSDTKLPAALERLIEKWRKNGEGSRSVGRYGQPTAAGCSMLTCADELEALAPMLAEREKAAEEAGLNEGCDALFQAANTAILNLSSEMELPKHPVHCSCYGCGLRNAVVKYALEHGKRNVLGIVEREVAAEENRPVRLGPLATAEARAQAEAYQDCADSVFDKNQILGQAFAQKAAKARERGGI